MFKLHIVLLSAALLTATVASAQTTYRWIDKDTGLTVYSDQAPPAGAKQVVKMTGEERFDDQQLPYTTRQAAEKFPVTLYTTANCVEACKQARGLLNGRGIPFTENMLKNDEELAELAKKLDGEATVPTLFVGRQSLKGLEYSAWNNLLDLAGYPKTAPYGAKPSGAFAK
ncbi:glutaredoxin family protein [Propionivibrio sp.]|uniref:glutaredoxin family protein n=1 Tax=Propionivibrio sp. TaxID=2212460 RepID=UPI002617C54F|nr:glutaredoxin family protein [Propionivibrio sp.]